jgi:hypothetical protein
MIRRSLFTTLILALSAFTRADEVDWNAYLAAERVAANATIESGELTAGAARVMASLRAVPQDAPQYADTAWTSLQLLVFTMEYLMDDATLTAFLTQNLHANDTPMDRTVAAIYDIYIGQDSQGKAEAARRLDYIAAGDIVLPKLFALFTLSDPYYFENNAFATQHSTILAADFPTLELTQTALNFPAYESRNESKSGALQKAIAPAKSGDDAKARTTRENARAAWSRRYHERAQTAAAQLALQATMSEGVSGLLQGATADSDWQTRYACLLTVERFRHQGFEGQIKSSCEQLAARAQCTPDVLRARILLARVNAKKCVDTPTDEGARREAVKWAEELLTTPIEAYTPERNLYEDRMKGIRQTAKLLAKAGHVDEARRLFRALAANFPRSLVADECATELAQLGPESE